MSSRREWACEWDASFWRRSPLFWPIARAASALDGFRDWPEPADLARTFDGDPPVHFELAAPKPRRRRLSDATRYDERIATSRVVPTRARSWHDLLNALVWASFPRAKVALHARQHRMIAARLRQGGLGPQQGRGRLPSARTKEQDAVAMLDEGGVVLLCARGRAAAVADAIAHEAAADVGPLVAEGTVCAIVFGHAIYEELACGGGPALVRGSAYVEAVDTIDPDGLACVAVADAALAAILEREAPITRGDFGSVVVDERLARTIAS